MATAPDLTLLGKPDEVVTAVLEAFEEGRRQDRLRIGGEIVKVLADEAGVDEATYRRLLLDQEELERLIDAAEAWSKAFSDHRAGWLPNRTELEDIVRRNRS